VKVTDLAQRLMVSQPLVSWHLSILRRMEFVRTRRQGREVYCSLDAARYQQCVALLAAVIGEEQARQPARVGPISSGRRRKNGEMRC
jgi:DNA-binding transcriptional ArsR family regulator